ncbi:protein TIFY 6B-like [Euphorbia lathyris]|uniref:protein TIFY 6B-like n=1 Tax=Euphorbia lathyris TaxID=212925 RepID=UPI0033134060
MERDFLGLSSKEPLAVVKEEVNSEGFQEIGVSKGSGMQMHWPFPNKVSALPHFMSFKVAQEDKTKRIAMSPGLLTLSTADAFDHSQKPAITEIQKSLNHERQGGTNFTLTAYPVQHPHEVKTFPVSNYSNSISMSNPFFKNHFAATKPVATPQPIRPTAGYVAGITESCSKPSASPAQLTIFYAGTVSVYDSISPEKAQAIMLLAGNGSSISQPKIQVQEPSSKPVASDCSPLTHPVSTSPSSRLSSPLSVSSHAAAQSGSGSTSTEENLAAKTTGAATTPISKVDTPKIATGTGSVNASTLIPSVPQARKASLARFLEKRKERVMSSGPYNVLKKCDGMDIQL